MRAPMWWARASAVAYARISQRTWVRVWAVVRVPPRHPNLIALQQPSQRRIRSTLVVGSPGVKIQMMRLAATQNARGSTRSASGSPQSARGHRSSAVGSRQRAHTLTPWRVMAIGRGIVRLQIRHRHNGLAVRRVCCGLNNLIFWSCNCTEVSTVIGDGV